MDPYESPQPEPANHRSVREHPQGEPLRIEHFVLYVAGVAVACWLNPIVYGRIASLHLHGLFTQHLLEPLLQGAGLAAIGLLVLRRFQRRPSFPTQFGHWLLLLQATWWLAETLFTPLQRHVEIQAVYHPDGWTQFVNPHVFLLTIYVLIWLVAAAVPVLAVFHSKGQSVWQAYAVALALNMIWMALRPFFGHDEAMIWISGAMLLGFISFGLFFGATFRDGVLRQPRDQLHWTGIAFQVGVTLVLRLLRLV
jgi:hypothetical protein